MKPVFFPTPAAFRAWLRRHHRTTKEVLVGFHKRHTGKPTLTWPESVDEALCFGWIDGVRRSISPGAYAIRFTPRKSGSRWSAVNVRKAKALLAAKRMAPSGRRAFEGRDRKADYAYEQRHAAVLPPALAARLRANRRASKHFEAKPPWCRRAAIFWVTSAKQEKTRDSRLATLIACSARGEDIPSLRRRPGKT